MNRLIALMLIPLFVVGNSFAHSHGSPALSSQGYERAHIHVGSASHHDGSHESHDHAHGHSHHDQHQHSHEEDHGCDDTKSTPAGTADDHDSDAIYLVSVDLTLNCGDRTSVEADVQAWVHSANSSFVDLPARIQHPQLDHSPPPKRLPLYLLNAALRL